MSEEAKKVRLRKVEENEILGPMEMSELKGLADSAYISPGDEVSFEDEEWQRAYLIEELGMCWTIRSKDGVEYGPTTEGTIREFVSAGEIDKDAVLINNKTRNETTVRALVGEAVIAKFEAEKQEQAILIPDGDFTESMEVAKDIRIRTLEVEYDALKKEFEELSQKYRRTAEELLTLKKTS